MATRRVGAKAIDWVAFAERVPPNQRQQFSALKAKADALKVKLKVVPEKPAAINWDAYRKAVPVAGLVDKFQKEFEALNVPYPKDTATAAVNESEKEMDGRVQKFTVESNQRIKQYESEIAALNSMIPFEEMTVEEYQETYPETKLDTKKYPFWPHFDLAEIDSR